MDNTQSRNQSTTPSLCNYLKSTSGQTLIEYVLIIIVIAVALIAAMTLFSTGLSTTYSNAAASIPSSP